MQSVELNFVDSCSRQFLRNKDNTWLTKTEPKLTLTSTVRAQGKGVGCRYLLACGCGFC